MVLDQVVDLAAVWGVGTLGLAALCTTDDEVRHVEYVLVCVRSWGSWDEDGTEILVFIPERALHGNVSSLWLRLRQCKSPDTFTR